MKKYKAILYDIDGTLLNTLDMNMIPLLRIIEEETGQRWTYEDVLKFVPYPGIKVMEELGITDKETVYKRWVKYVNEYEGGAVLYDGISQVLNTLGSHFLQAVVSAKTREQYEIDVVSKGLNQYIKAAVLADDTKKHKPDPEPLLLCLDRLGLSADEALYIGDSFSDYSAAKNAGIDFGYAKWGSVSSEGIESPDYVLEQPWDLLMFLDSCI